MENPHHRSVTSRIIVPALAMFALSLFVRVYSARNTLTDEYLFDYYRVGTIPWSDAKHWVAGALQVMEGRQITGPAAQRPLYAIFLATLFALVGTSYRWAIGAQMTLAAGTLALAYVILRPVRPRWFVAWFLGLLILWRPDVSTVFMTENLGIYLLILSLSMFMRGLLCESRGHTLAGFFFFGLSQAVRPWCFAALCTLPWIAFWAGKRNGGNWRLFLLYSFFMLGGVGIHGVAGAAFSTSGGFANVAHTLYGQVSGGRGWDAIYDDPVIGERLRSSAPGDLAAKKQIYARILDLFLEDPNRFFTATTHAYRQYVYSIPKAFRAHKGIDFLLVMLVIGVILRPEPTSNRSVAKGQVAYPFWVRLKSYTLRRVPRTRLAARQGSNGAKRSGNAYAALASRSTVRSFFRAMSSNFLPVTRNRFAVVAFLVVAAIAWQCWPGYFWAAVVILGFLYALRHITESIHAFMILYAVGILLSLPVVAADGGERVKISSDIFLFLVAASAVRWVLPRQNVGPAAGEVAPGSRWVGLAGPVICVGVFLLVPYIQRVAATSNPDRQMPSINATEIAQALHLDAPPIGPEELNRRWADFPKPSYETLENQWAYDRIRYHHRDSIYFDAWDGIPVSSRDGELWPLLSANMRRTVLVIERQFAMFPHTSQERLRAFDGRDMVVVGRLLTRPRAYRSATGYVLVVSYIGQWDESSGWQWRSVNDL